MSISSQITRIQEDRNTLRNWTIAAGLTEASADLDDIADAVSKIDIKGGVSAEVQEGQSYTIPRGYHDGSGTVAGVSGGGNYTLQAKTNIIPTKDQQTISSDDGYYGLSSVTIKPIPAAYQDVTSVTAAAEDVRANKIIVDATGKTVTGTATDNGAITRTLDATTTSTTIPKGFHSGTGTVSIVTEEKTATPTKSTQNITPTVGKVLSKVTVNPIPAAYADASTTTVDASKMLSGTTAIGKDASGNAVTVTGNIATTTTVTSASGTIATDTDTTKFKVSGSYAEGGKYLGSTGTTTVKVAKTQFGNATSANVLEGVTFTSEAGIKQDGSIKNNGSTSGSFDGLTTLSYSVPAGYTTGGTVTLTDDIEEALAAI